MKFAGWSSLVVGALMLAQWPQLGQWPLVGMFAALLVLAVVNVVILMRAVAFAGAAEAESSP